MAAAKSKEEWAKIRGDAEQGMTDPDLVKKYGVTREAIRKRRYDDAGRSDPWMTPREREKAAALKAVEDFYKGKSNASGATGNQLILSPVTEDELSEMRTKTPQELAKHIHKLLRDGIGLLRAPTNIDEYNKFYSLYQKMLGLDKREGPVVSLQFGGMQWGAAPAQEKPIILEAQTA